MTKKRTNWLSYLPVATLGVGLLAGGIRFQLQAENTKTEVKELKADTKTKIEKVEADIKEIAEEGDKEIKELKKTDAEFDKQIEVTKTNQENIKQAVEDTNKKVTDVMNLLLEMKAKKK